ncbi:MAG: dihydroneopterin triphosphate diphosphatase [Gammaproteobacteria bacterium]|nr:dihydroneopterin triphosphate diphosphatase [Gammaproteobacteria bacterium]
MSRYKRPESVLVVVYTRAGKVLLLRRSDKTDFWQSVTGSMRWDESDPEITAGRELREETSIEVTDDLRDWGKTFRFQILPQWAHRYAPGTKQNIEHMFSLELPEEVVITMNPVEHAEFVWLPFAEASQRVTSWTNREAIDLIQATCNLGA